MTVGSDSAGVLGSASPININTRLIINGDAVYEYPISGGFKYISSPMNEAIVGVEPKLQIVATQMGGGVYGGTPNINGSSKNIIDINFDDADGRTGFTGLGSAIGVVVNGVSKGVNFDLNNPSTTYREIAAVMGNVTAKNGGLLEAYEFTAYDLGTAVPTKIYGGVINVVKNNADETLESSALFLRSTGSYRLLRGIQFEGHYQNMIDLEHNTTIDNFAIVLPAGKPIALSGVAHDTHISGNSDGSQILFTTLSHQDFGFIDGGYLKLPNLTTMPANGLPAGWVCVVNGALKVSNGTTWN